MERDPLKKLLAGADGHCPGGKPLNAVDIRQTARRRARRTRLLATSLVLVAGASAALLLVHNKMAPTTPAPAAGQTAQQSVPPIPAPLGAVESPGIAAQIDMLAQTITDRRRARERMQGVEPVNIADEREDAARTMVMTAPLRAEVAGPAEARSLYERAVALYPDTQSAAAARLELARLQPLQ